MHAYLVCCLSSAKDPANIQHRDEIQDEGPHDDRGRRLLEVDLAQHPRPGDEDIRLPLVHGRRLHSGQDVRQAFIARRVPDHQLQDRP